jgi:phosphoribosyl 1,2-cyclic phosphodiesterase
MRITLLASGSAGNATLFEANGTRVLVDAGLGPRALEARLHAVGAGLPHAIVVTHAHQDHVGHCLRLARRYRVPVYASEATARAPVLQGQAEVRVFSAREPFAIGALTLAPTPLPHDAAQVAIVVEAGARRAAIVTDLGEVPPGLLPHLARCDVVLIESNHDSEMLERGPYPAFLKRRITSARGHLSNAQTHALLRALPGETHTVVLMHLSKSNNRPDLALASARDALAGRRVRLLAATQEGCFALDTAPDTAPDPMPAARPDAAGEAHPPLAKTGERPAQLSLFA